jgi:16S rRNA (guanine966-N2)-methyltransferase
MPAIRGLAARGRHFSLVFADPPYEQGWSKRLPAALGESGVLALGAIFVLEHHRKEPPEGVPSGFSLWTDRRFGDTMLSIWRWTGAGDRTDAVAGPDRSGGETA